MGVPTACPDGFEVIEKDCRHVLADGRVVVARSRSEAPCADGKVPYLDACYGELVVAGTLDKALIGAEVARNMDRIRHCYQKELTRKRDLTGKITVKFVIDRDGSVRQAIVQSTTMNDADVEGCITNAFLRFQFPEPTGGVVVVSYPFVFKPE